MYSTSTSSSTSIWGRRTPWYLYVCLYLDDFIGVSIIIFKPGCGSALIQSGSGSTKSLSQEPMRFWIWSTSELLKTNFYKSWKSKFRVKNTTSSYFFVLLFIKMTKSDIIPEKMAYLGYTPLLFNHWNLNMKRWKTKLFKGCLY
jgi:hypothetical protein